MAMEPHLAFILAVFLVAGTVKGAVGLGLPLVAMGLLVVAMPPQEAAAVLVIPSILTNGWQMLAGPHLRALAKRLWPMLLLLVGGTLAGAGWLAPENTRLVTIGLGAVLILYALIGLSGLQLHVAPAQERWATPLAGLLTGLTTAATGVFSVPSVPYLQSIGLEKDALIQAMGLCFSVATLALAFNLATVGAFSTALGWPVLAAIAGAAGGLRTGQLLRSRLDPPTFRLWFLVALLVLGVYLAARAML